MLERLSPPEGAVKKKKRLGRGRASGLGKTSGRGHKGQRSRAGSGVKPGFEGGQMPLQRRLPKRGFTNIFRVENQAVNLGVIAAAFKAGDTVSPETLIEKGMIKARKGPVKVLGAGEISIPLTIRANAFSSSAVSKIEAAGGKAEVI